MKEEILEMETKFRIYESSAEYAEVLGEFPTREMANTAVIAIRMQGNPFAVAREVVELF